MKLNQAARYSCATLNGRRFFPRKARTVLHQINKLLPFFLVLYDLDFVMTHISFQKNLLLIDVTRMTTSFEINLSFLYATTKYHFDNVVILKKLKDEIKHKTKQKQNKQTPVLLQNGEKITTSNKACNH